MFTFFKKKTSIKATKLTDHKTLSNYLGYAQNLPIYPQYYISLTQRDGEQSIPTVKLGDIVAAGDIIARPTSDMALYCHAPTSGEVTAISEINETHPSAMPTQAIEITANGLDTPSTALTAIKDYRNIGKDKLLQRLREAGITGMGGAGFPAEKKIKSAGQIDTLIINGAECEPYITCDDILMRNRAREILLGAQIIAHIIQAKQILIGIEDNKTEAITAMKRACTLIGDSRCQIHILPSLYPMGSRQQIAHYLLGKKMKKGKRAYQYGFICHNVATAKACYDAISGKALIERYLTLSGDAVIQPSVVNVRIGTLLSDLLSTFPLSDDKANVVIGGTMMGFNAPDWQTHKQVIQGQTTSILAFKPPDKTNDEQNCIRCNQCVKVCPMALLPQQLFFFSKSQHHTKAQANRLFDCIECGLCSYVCPSSIPLVEYFQNSKAKIALANKKSQASQVAKTRFDFRNQRLEKAKVERELKLAERRKKIIATTPITREQSSNDHLNTQGLAPTKMLEEVTQNKQSSLQDTQPKSHEMTDKKDLIAQALARSQQRKSQLSHNKMKKTEK